MRNPRMTRQIADSAANLEALIVEAFSDGVVTPEKQVRILKEVRRHYSRSERCDKRYQLGLRLIGGGDVSRGMVSDVKKLEMWCEQIENHLPPIPFDEFRWQEKSPSMVEIERQPIEKQAA